MLECVGSGLSALCIREFCVIRVCPTLWDAKEQVHVESSHNFGNLFTQSSHLCDMISCTHSHVSMECDADGVQYHPITFIYSHVVGHKVCSGSTTLSVSWLLGHWWPFIHSSLVKDRHLGHLLAHIEQFWICAGVQLQTGSKVRGINLQGSPYDIVWK
jgi:hypothetical protein